MRFIENVSRKERKILLIIGFATFILAFTNFISSTIEDYNREVEIEQQDLIMEANDGLTFSKDYGTDYRPFHRFRLTFLTFFIFLGLLRPKRFFIPAFFTLLSVIIFVSWFVRTNRDIELNTLYMAGTPHLLKIATLNDYSLFLLILILLGWQISIFVRIFLKRSKRINLA